jgi:D-alanine-D-alanine ligase
MKEPIIAVLSGGVSGEREVSQRSATALLTALEKSFPVELFDVSERAIPPGLDPNRHVVVSALHGTFGEDGGMQGLLESAGFAFAGSDAASSRLCMNKTDAKEVAASAGVLVPAGMMFDAESPPVFSRVAERLGTDLIVKPNSEGSSIGLHFVAGEADFRQAMGELTVGRWILERRVVGRELTVGVLQGKALGVVEIIPLSGKFDYKSKYTKGLTSYRWPAELPSSSANQMKRMAETVFERCGCRDFARVDFMFSDVEGPFFLEINTIPGLTETSLLPKSALCEEIDFAALARALVTPARDRFIATQKRTAR